MNKHRPPLIGLYILYTVILIAAIVYLSSRHSLSTQISAPAIEEMQDTAATTLPAKEVSSAEVISSEAVSEDTASDEAASTEEPSAAKGDSVKTDFVEADSAQVTDTGSNDSLPSSDGNEAIGSVPVNSSSSIPFISKCRINLHIRQYPSMSGKIIGRIPTRASGLIIELVNDEWAKIIYKDITGYSAYRYLDFDSSFGTDTAVQEESKESAASEEAEAIASEASSVSSEEVIPQVQEQDVIVIRSSCYIRSSAGDKNKRNIIMTAQGKDVFPHMAAYDQPSWYAIAVEGQSIAFVSTKYASAQTITAE